MLNKLRKQFTTLYTTIIGIFLLAFVVIVCCGLTWLIYSERIDEMRTFAQEISEEQQTQLIEFNKDENKRPNISNLENKQDLSGQTFYYIFDQKGRLVIEDRPLRILKNAIVSEIKTWPTARDSHVMIVSLANDQSATVILASKKIFVEDRYEGIIYVGKDITAYYRVLGRIVVVLVGVGCLFVFLASLIGYLLSGRVMLPVMQSANRQKEFMADASHELRTPLSILLTSLDAVQGDECNQISAFSHQIVEDMRDEILKLTKIISDLLTLARADGGDIKIIQEKFMIEPVIEQVIRTLQMSAQAKNLCITLMMESTDIMMFADRERIRQLLFILVDNAIKYTPADGNITIGVKNIIETEKDFVQMIVQDTGVGISAENQEKIFERFFRVDKARSREVGGTGLGLAIAYWIVQSHNGKIWVESQKGSGSSFIILIPIL